MAAVPHKRFDYGPMSKDGRGGWTFSQFGADRYVARPNHLAIKLGLAVWATPSVPTDYLEWTALTARAGTAVLGTDHLECKRPNKSVAHHREGSVYEWIQGVEAPITSSGLLTIEIRLKLQSQNNSLLVEGTPMVHVSCEGTDDRLVSSDEYEGSLDDPNRSFTW
ncbi:MAG: hypothetical protein Rhob2KO_02690 [Rhodopirellula baltica]